MHLTEIIYINCYYSAKEKKKKNEREGDPNLDHLNLSPPIKKHRPSAKQLTTSLLLHKVKNKLCFMY